MTDDREVYDREVVNRGTHSIFPDGPCTRCGMHVHRFFGVFDGEVWRVFCNDCWIVMAEEGVEAMTDRAKMEGRVAERPVVGLVVPAQGGFSAAVDDQALSDAELHAIEKRATQAPGYSSPDSWGAPVVHLGYAERFLNRLPETEFYLRRRQDETPEDYSRREMLSVDRLKSVWAPAYQAHSDVLMLLAEVKRLRRIGDAR